MGVTAGATLPAFKYLAPVEHGLERLAQSGKIQRRVLHFERDAVQEHELAIAIALSVSTGVNAAKAVLPSSKALITPLRRGMSGMLAMLLWLRLGDL